MAGEVALFGAVVAFNGGMLYKQTMSNKYDDVVKRIERVYRDAARRVPLTEEQLIEVETELEYSLPSDYREFLRDYGGIGVNAIYPLKDSRKEETVFMFFDTEHFAALAKINSQDESFELEYVPTMRQVLFLDEEATAIGDPPRELLPIAIDMGGNQVYLALAGRQPGAIYLWMNWFDIYFVADSFDEFMQSLQHWEQLS